MVPYLVEFSQSDIAVSLQYAGSSVCHLPKSFKVIMNVACVLLSVILTQFL